MLFRDLKIVIGKLVCLVTLLGLGSNIAFSSLSFVNAPNALNKKTHQSSYNLGIKQLQTDASVYFFDMEEEDEEDLEDFETLECIQQSFSFAYHSAAETPLTLKSNALTPYTAITPNVPRWLLVRHIII